MSLVSPDEFLISDGAESVGLFAKIDHTTGKHALLFGNDEGTFDIDPSDWSCWKITSLNYPHILIPGLAIEVDLTSAFDSETQPVAYGTIVRRAQRLTLHTKSVGPSHLERTFKVDLLADLPSSAAGASIGFSKWALVRTVADEKQVYQRFDIERATAYVR